MGHWTSRKFRGRRNDGIIFLEFPLGWQRLSFRNHTYQGAVCSLPFRALLSESIQSYQVWDYLIFTFPKWELLNWFSPMQKCLIASARKIEDPGGTCVGSVEQAMSRLVLNALPMTVIGHISASLNGPKKLGRGVTRDQARTNRDPIQARV